MVLAAMGTEGSQSTRWSVQSSFNPTSNPFVVKPPRVWPKHGIDVLECRWCISQTLKNFYYDGIDNLRVLARCQSFQSIVSTFERTAEFGFASVAGLLVVEPQDIVRKSCANDSWQIKIVFSSQVVFV